MPYPYILSAPDQNTPIMICISSLKYGVKALLP